LTSVLEARLHNLGIAGSVTQPAGTSAVVITINRAPLPAATLRALIEPGELGMYDLEGDLMSPSIDKNGNPVPHRDKLKLGAKTTLVTCGGPGTHALLCPGGADPTVKNYYLLKRDPGHHVPQLTAADLNPRGVKQDFDAVGQPIVRLVFTSKGDRTFQRLTRRLWQRGHLRKASQHFAI